MSTIEYFRAAMHTAGLCYAGPISADGKLHRFKTEGDRASNSWYVLYPDTPAAGAFGCWKRAVKNTWCERNRSLSQAESDLVRQKWEEAEREREQIESKKRAKAQKKAKRIFERATKVQSHPYLDRKGVEAHGGLRQREDLLVLPLHDVEGVIHSVQFIAPDKRFDGERDKTFLGGGRTKGCFFTVSDSLDGPLVICEGYATGSSIFEATGFATVCAMHAGNLLEVGKSLRQKFLSREIIVAADDDEGTDGNPGVTKAQEAALAISARLAVPQFVDLSSRPTDFNDLARLVGTTEVRRQIETAALAKETDEELFRRLAKLTRVDYDRQREGEAKRSGIRVGTLDDEVAKCRTRAEVSKVVQGSKLTFAKLEPWPAPVNGAALLDEIAFTLNRFVVAPIEAIVAASLFVLHTYAFDLGEISPILFITSPTKRCGKSKLLVMLLRLVCKPLAASSATAAGIYRAIEVERPTLLIDEVDAFMKGNEQLRGLINSGHTRDAAFHLCCAPNGDKEMEPRLWSTWAPKIFSGIGRLADTIEDRAIIIKMVRRRKDERYERLLHRTRFDDICRKALRFVNEHAHAIQNGNSAIPEALNDRAADNWTPLLILADLAGGDWPAKARQSALVLAESNDTEALGANVQLLADIRDVFRNEAKDKLTSKALAEHLAQLEGRPWAEYGKERRPISVNQIANLLRGFEISPRTIRLGKDTAKGYAEEDFSDASSRFLADTPLLESDKVTSAANAGESGFFEEVTAKACAGSKSAVLGNNHGGCDLVTCRNAEKEEAMLL